jgi:hypothetical protein
MYFIKRAFTIYISSTLVIFNIYPAYAGLLDILEAPGTFFGNVAVKAGASKKLGTLISDGVNYATPTVQAKYLVKGLAETGVIKDSSSCAAFSELASTGAAAVAAYYSGGAAAGVAKGLGGQVMGKACSEQYGSAGSAAEKEAAMQAYTQNAESVNAEILKAQIDAGVRIVELQTQSKVKEAKILAKSALDVENTKQNGETTRAILQSKTLLKMTEMNNLTDLELARIDLEKTRDTNATDLAKTKDTNATDLAKTKLQTQAGTIQTGISAGAQVLTALINRPRQPKEPPQTVQVQPQQIVAVAPTDPVDTLFREWGWQKVSCSPGLVFIKGLSAETVCTNPTSDIPAGEYFYNSSSSQLEPVAVSPSVSEINSSSMTEEEHENVGEVNEEGEDQ